MKKLIAMILAVMMMAALACAALADEVPQPEGGKKFEGSWAIMMGKVDIVYEEEGYRVRIDLYNKEALSGEIREYSCYYVEADDALESISSLKHLYTVDPEKDIVTDGENEYEGFDDEDSVTKFTINENGKLVWADGHENAGADLEFQPIGNFEGVWENKAEEVYAEISWTGMEDEENFYYMLYVRRGADENAVESTMLGRYNWETGKLEAVVNPEDGTNPLEDAKAYDAFFSMQEDGKLLYEADKGIELEYVDRVVSNG